MQPSTRCSAISNHCSGAWRRIPCSASPLPPPRSLCYLPHTLALPRIAIFADSGNQGGRHGLHDSVWQLELLATAAQDSYDVINTYVLVGIAKCKIDASIKQLD